MSFDGTWNCVMNGPMGKQSVQVILTSAGNALSGKLSAPQGEEPIHDGKFSGDTATWKCSVKKPVTLTLEFNVRQSGDSLSGEVKLGLFGKCLLTGTRA